MESARSKERDSRELVRTTSAAANGHDKRSLNKIDRRNLKSVCGSIILGLKNKRTSSVTVGSDTHSSKRDATGRMTVVQTTSGKASISKKIHQGRYYTMTTAGSSLFNAELHLKLRMLVRDRPRFDSMTLAYRCRDAMHVLRNLLSEQYPDLQGEIVSRVILSVYDITSDGKEIPKLKLISMEGYNDAIIEDVEFCCCGSYTERPLEYLSSVYHTIQTDDEGVEAIREGIRIGFDEAQKHHDTCIGGNERVCLMVPGAPHVNQPYNKKDRHTTHFDFGRIAPPTPSPLQQALSFIGIRLGSAV